MTLKKIDHEFKNEALSYDAKPNYQPYIRLSFFFSKLPQVSYEQFHRHWETVHADLTIATKDFVVCDIKRYVQFHQTPELKEKAKSLGMETMDYDGCSELWVKNMDDALKFFSCEDYAKLLAPDCDHFMAMPVRCAIGYDNVIFGDKMPGGTDGVIASNVQSRS